jgi:serine/threonine-protein kinase
MLLKKVCDNGHPVIAMVVKELGELLILEGKFAEAEMLYRENLARQRKLYGDENAQVALCARGLVFVLFKQGKLSEAETTSREALPMIRKLYASEHASLEDSLILLGKALEDLGKLAEAETIYREVVEREKQIHGDGHFHVARGLCVVGGVLVEESRLVEAEAVYRQAFVLEQNIFSHGDEHILALLSTLGSLLRKQSKSADAETLLREYVSPERPTSSAQQSAGQTTDRLQLLANLEARCGLWSDAVAHFRQLTRLDSENHWHYHQLAPALAHNGDLDLYRRHCALVLARFADTTDPVVAERMAKDCLILACPRVDLSAVDKLTKMALTAGKRHPFFPFFEFASGLADYRQGRFTSAVECMRKVLESKGFVYRDAQANLVLAMSQWQVHQSEEAHSALAAGAEILSRDGPKMDGNDLGPEWTDWVIAHALLNEAKTLIERQQ